jgi:hypothetical protein
MEKKKSPDGCLMTMVLFLAAFTICVVLYVILTILNLFGI